MPATTSDTSDLIKERSTAHRPATVAPWAQAVSVLSEALGSQLVAHIAGVSPETVSRWASGKARNPNIESERKVRLAFRIFTELSSVEERHTIRAWFIGANPYLGEDSPAQALINDRDRAVLAAATEFQQGG
ncbi:hypothetical protein [Flexivirga alba]|uniref:XRE family transcriptional regulator n=1 Tax=Flexivirga alba TaxID=702742 RepID=A0ABW2ADZ5_9MICO